MAIPLNFIRKLMANRVYRLSGASALENTMVLMLYSMTNDIAGLESANPLEKATTTATDTTSTSTTTTTTPHYNHNTSYHHSNNYFSIILVVN